MPLPWYGFMVSVPANLEFSDSLEILGCLQWTLSGNGEREGRGTPIGDPVYMCLPWLWVSLRYFALVIGLLDECWLSVQQ